MFPFTSIKTNKIDSGTHKQDDRLEPTDKKSISLYTTAAMSEKHPIQPRMHHAKTVRLPLSAVDI